MTWLQIVVLSIVQGLTEFLPVSSSAHLILVSQLMQWPDQGLALDVAVHLGTLFSVLIYFRHELRAMLSAWWSGAGPAAAEQRRLGLALVVASIPAMLAGWLAYDFIAIWLRDARIIAVTTIVFGLVLWLADRFAPRHLALQDMRLQQGLWIGVAQVLALVPGTSRSGITITMGRLLGFDAHSAATFSFLLSIPIIAAAGGNGVWRLAAVEGPVAWQPFALAVTLSALAGLLCIAGFLLLLRRVGLTPFIIYRLLLGVVLLLLIN